jgi:HJR/Mrr/RecB family endonuclease
VRNRDGKAGRNESSGWTIEQWAASQRGDHGIDIVVSKADRLAIVQCKFWDPSRAVGPNIIRDLIGARAAVGKIVEALLITSSRLTEGAIKLAEETGVKFVQSVDFTKPSLLPEYD